LQHLARFAGRELIVQNLSLQTDSADLLGGYRPLEIKNVARRLYQDFVDHFTATFSRKQNAEFLQFASDALQKENWKSLSQCFCRASKLGLMKMNARGKDDSKLAAWKEFQDTSERFEKQRLACDTGMAFTFTEGALVDAIRSGKWVLLDEINLASSETLQRLCGLLDDSSSSITLTERGDVMALHRHPSFRLFAAMNPATDTGKRDLTDSIRSRFTEIFVDELVDPIELRQVAASYMIAVLPASERPPEHTDVVVSVVNLYLQCRELAEKVLMDGSGQKPRYTIRTLCRALTAAKTFTLNQKISLSRSLYEGFQLAFQGPLDQRSTMALSKIIEKYIGKDIDKKLMDHPGRRPSGSVEHTLIKPFWIKTGKLEPVDWSKADVSTSDRPSFILTPSTALNLRRLTRAIASGPWPILLEGPTSAGKTTLVEYVAARCGQNVVRINNHEHTDVQEYTGGFAADSNGKLSFQDGILVRALRLGYWVILDELNLAPSEVLEALNRLLDDNRELYLADTNEIVIPHPDFRLFATQNPSGAYGGRKPLSRAFRNRFVEIHVDDIPSSEMTSILEKRCGCAPSHSRILVDVMDALRRQRSKSGVFMGKDGLITPRDLLRWSERGASSKVELAQEGFMLLAERLRTLEEKKCVQGVIETHFKTKLNMNDMYFGSDCEARQILATINFEEYNKEAQRFLSSIAATRSLLRLLTLVMRCIRNKEPVLLVGGEYL
jgi:midasin